MKQNNSLDRPIFTADRWNGIFTTLLILAVIVIALVFVVLRLPVTNTAQPTVILTPTLAPAGLETQAAVQPVALPPIVDTAGIMVFGGLLVILILGVVLRELIWFRRQT